MRRLLAILLSLVFSMNAAFAAVHGVCDAFEIGAELGLMVEHSSHPGHHSHEHEHDHAVVDADDQKAAADAHSNHCHAHVHPSFASLLPADVVIPGQPGRESLSTPVAAAFVSADAARLERPPRASRA